MALTQEAILMFLVEQGGKAKNSDLLNTFKGLINCSDPVQKKENRELFKRFVNNVAVVKEIDDAKYVVMKKKYQHLLKGDAAFTYQNSEFGESPSGSTTVSPLATTSELRCFSQREVGKILNSDADNNNLSTVSRSNEDALNSNVLNSTSQLPLHRSNTGDRQCFNAAGVGNKSVNTAQVEISKVKELSPSVEGKKLSKMAQVETSKVKEFSPSADSKTGKTGAVFAIVAVKSESNLQNNEVQSKCDGSNLKTEKQGTPKSDQKPYMLPLRMPPTQIKPEAQEPDTKDKLVVRATSEHDLCRSPRSKRRQLEEAVKPGSPQLRRGYKTTKPGEEPKYSDTVPLDSMEHEWLVKSAAGHWSQVYGLLLQDTQLAEKKDFMSGFTALHWAAKSGNSEMVCKIIEISKRAGTEIDINTKTFGGYTPLHIAAIHNHESVMALLARDYGANTNIRDNSGKKPHHYLLKGASPEVKELLGKPQVVHQETQFERKEDDHFTDLPRGFNTLSRLFQPHSGHRKKHKQRPGFYSIYEDPDDEKEEGTSKRRPFSDVFL
ncbi:ankyrin repeat domain-containing protein SOWAHA-like [Megalops cyprinoides]|uniref:ankyrin repeat domain-containing protein SOWAHA-like n=1 Tax=Megalops cyprinoides TaxID=118141 RepID=UPI00186474FE|nr:ankyrin repeat domain-containing protein SOWAHA-like [Megalops cyprinoides]